MDERSPRALALDLAFCLALIIPLVITSHLPLLDLPGHLAVEQTIARLQAGGVSPYFTYQPGLVANLGLHLFVEAACRIVSIDAAFRLFAIATVLLLVWACRMAARTLAGPGAGAWRLAGLFVYGGPFQYGFQDYCFGVAAALLVFALWLRRRDWPLPALLGVFIPLGCLVLVCHMAAFGILGLAVGACELARAPLRALPGRWLRAAAWLLPPLVLYVIFAEHQAGGSPFLLDGVREKIEAVAALTLFAQPAIELPMLAVALLLSALALLAGLIKPRAEALVMLAGFALATLLLPRYLMGASLVDYRVPWGASFFVLSGITTAAPVRLRWLKIAPLFAALIALRVSMLAVAWWSWDPILAGIDGALRTLPENAALMVAEGDPNSESAKRRPPLIHSAGYGTASRGLFDPSGFAGLPGQLVSLRPGWADQWRVRPPSAVEVIDPRYGYLLVLRPDLVRLGSGLNLQCLARGQDFTLYSVTPTGGLAACRP